MFVGANLKPLVLCSVDDGNWKLEVMTRRNKKRSNERRKITQTKWWTLHVITEWKNNFLEAFVQKTFLQTKNISSDTFCTLFWINLVYSMIINNMTLRFLCLDDSFKYSAIHMKMMVVLIKIHISFVMLLFLASKFHVLEHYYSWNFVLFLLRVCYVCIQRIIYRIHSRSQNMVNFVYFLLHLFW